jgi:hypothetical protein
MERSRSSRQPMERIARWPLLLKGGRSGEGVEGRQWLVERGQAGGMGLFSHGERVAEWRAADDLVVSMRWPVPE